ncbi:sulfotransferase [Oscillatoriales cyanobacterium LEGE 11467]|uniref:Sulfotransferase n=1 Tax=Zarconia navalis LEGE 11467 TaxID=1828826 RepID=A0A928VVY0_9CYAN|nr:sulfotransferase [Zarconia navalis]MBE9040278.1 sulfotransferase [Zarconia navalis LEGE 11467]
MTVEIPVIAKPIFLVGAERSGTTVLRLMFANHPQLAWCNEFEYAVDRISEDGTLPPLEEYYEWLDAHRVFRASGFEIDRDLTYSQLVNSFLCQKKNKDGKPFVGGTVHRHFNRLLGIWPNARFIHIVRDGRDVARSCIGMGWAGNVWTGSKRWLEAEQLWTRFSSNLPEERFFEIKYETLIEKPVETLTHLCEFIGIPYDEAMLNYARNTTYGLPDVRFIAQWRRKLSEEEIQLVESRAGKMLVERGYELSGLPPKTVNEAMRQRLQWQDTWERAQFRLRRYGVPLFLENYLARRVGSQKWKKQVKLKIHAVEANYLK